MAKDQPHLSDDLPIEVTGSNTVQDEIQHVVMALAEPLGLTVQFATGKRRSDVFTMQLRGDRQRAMAFYEHVNRVLPHLSVELFNIDDPEHFGMIAAVTNPNVPSSSIHNERRKRNLHSYVAKRD